MMPEMPAGMQRIYLEKGKKRVFAGSIDWMGWCRSGRDEVSALQALFDYAPRYAAAIKTAKFDFSVPKNIVELSVVEQLEGNLTTDLGAPDAVPVSDLQPVDNLELERLIKLLESCWHAFNKTVENARGKELKLGPRGGGRSLDKIEQHVLEGSHGYLRALGGNSVRVEGEIPSREVLRKALLETLTASAHSKIPTRGPRGGKRWTARFFVRREAWHVLDHMWEIEDRLPDGV